MSNSHKPDKEFWIPFGVGGVCVAVFGTFRFSGPGDDVSLLLCLALGFAIACLPWVTGVKIKGFIEIDRKIETAKSETNRKISGVQTNLGGQIDKVSMDVKTAISSIQSQVAMQNTEIKTAISSIQSQVTTQSAEVKTALSAMQSQVATQSAKFTSMPTFNINTEAFRSAQNLKEKEEPVVSEKDQHMREIEKGFALATAKAVGDLPKLQCALLIKEIPDNGLEDTNFEIARKVKGVSDIQLEILREIGLIDVKSENDKTYYVRTALGQIYSDHWFSLFDWLKKTDWSKIKKGVGEFLGSVLKGVISGN